MTLAWKQISTLPDAVSENYQDAYLCVDYPLFFLHSFRFPGVGFSQWYLTAYLDESKKTIPIAQKPGCEKDYGEEKMNIIFDWAGLELSKFTKKSKLFTTLAMTSKPIGIVMRGLRGRIKEGSKAAKDLKFLNSKEHYVVIGEGLNLVATDSQNYVSNSFAPEARSNEEKVAALSDEEVDLLNMTREEILYEMNNGAL